MTEAADPVGINFQIADVTRLDFPKAQFDFATAFMSFMDMPDQATALHQAHRVLADGGVLQFSILHPCFVPPQRKTLRDANGEVYAVEVADYFRRTDGEIDTWTFGAAPPEEQAKHPPFNVPRFHRTLSDWVGMIQSAGFVIEAVQEPMADEETAAKFPDVADTRVTPIFLHFRVRKFATADKG